MDIRDLMEQGGPYYSEEEDGVFSWQGPDDPLDAGFEDDSTGVERIYSTVDGAIQDKAITHFLGDADIMEIEAYPMTEQYQLHLEAGGALDGDFPEDIPDSWESPFRVPDGFGADDMPDDYDSPFQLPDGF